MRRSETFGRALRCALAIFALGLGGLLAAEPARVAPAAPALAQALTPPAGAQAVPPVAVLDVKGAIGPATSDYITRGLAKARAQGASAVVLRIDTPGGLSSSMREIIQEILASPLPVLTYVAPAGARAASAGTYILYASHVAAMAPGTNLGAATPVRIGGPGLPGLPRGPKDEGEKEKEKEKPGKEGEKKEDAAKPKPGLDAKAVSDARAYIRALAQLRGRNVEWAEKAVTEAASLSADEALAQNVIDITAENVADLLDKAHGRKVKMAAGTVTLNTRGAATIAIAPDWRTEFLGTITNPNIAYILLMIGIYGIIFEFYNPGTIFSGVIGAICLVLALFALNVLPVNLAGLALILLGVALMAAEAFVPSFGILGIGGIASLVLGSLMLIDTDAPGFGISWVTIGSVAALSGLLSLTVLALAAKAWRRPVVSGAESMIGMRGRVIEWKGTEGRVRVHGEVWAARAETKFRAGDEIRVLALDGLTLSVAPANTEGADHG